jgi:nitrogen fixation NifU-like protein
VFDNDFYRELILDHARNRRNWRVLEPADFDHEESNSLCGDQLRLTLQINDQHVITAVGWEGEGCAVSQASASLLGEQLVGMTLQQAQLLTAEFIFDLIGGKLTPNRMKCALLPLKVLLVGTAGERYWEQFEDELT